MGNPKSRIRTWLGGRSCNGNGYDGFINITKKKQSATAHGMPRDVLTLKPCKDIGRHTPWAPRFCCSKWGRTVAAKSKAETANPQLELPRMTEGVESMAGSHVETHKPHSP